MSDLKPCPFCGDDAEWVDIHDDEYGNTGGSVIECVSCGASTHVEFGFKENLTSAWNRRAASRELVPAMAARIEELEAALEAVWSEATAAAYGAAANEAVMLCPVCGGTGREDDAECGDISFNTWVCRLCKGDKVLPNESILALTPQSSLDWMAEQEAAIRADERAKVISMAAHRMDNGWSYLAGNAIRGLHTDASRALQIKEKDDE